MAEGGNKMSGLGPPGLSLAGPPALAQWKKNLQAAPRPIEKGHPFQSSEFAPGHGAINPSENQWSPPLSYTKRNYEKLFVLEFGVALFWATGTYK